MPKKKAKKKTTYTAHGQAAAIEGKPGESLMEMKERTGQ
jgi:hypothetical protein